MLAVWHWLKTVSCDYSFVGNQIKAFPIGIDSSTGDVTWHFDGWRLVLLGFFTEFPFWRCWCKFRVLRLKFEDRFAFFKTCVGLLYDIVCNIWTCYWVLHAAVNCFMSSKTPRVRVKTLEKKQQTLDTRTRFDKRIVKCDLIEIKYNV